MFDDRNTKDEILEGGMRLYERFAEALVEIERLKAEAALWKDRWEDGRRDHEATMKHADDMMNEGPP